MPGCSLGRLTTVRRPSFVLTSSRHRRPHLNSSDPSGRWTSSPCRYDCLDSLGHSCVHSPLKSIAVEPERQRIEDRQFGGVRPHERHGNSHRELERSAQLLRDGSDERDVIEPCLSDSPRGTSATLFNAWQFEVRQQVIDPFPISASHKSSDVNVIRCWHNYPFLKGSLVGNESKLKLD